MTTKSDTASPRSTRASRRADRATPSRQKGSRNFRTAVLDTLRARVRVNSEGKPRSVSTQEAALLCLRANALKGDVRALDRIIGLARDYNDAELEAVLIEPVSAEDAAIIEQHETRLQRRLTVSETDFADPKKKIDP